jgi:hypothetical protein
MRIETCVVKAIRIYDAPKLDPIFVVMQDLGPGVGRLLIECYGDAWSGYWGAMGTDYTLERFLLGCSADYIAGKMLGSQHKRSKQSQAYILRIIEAVRTTLRNAQQHLPGGGE